MSEQTIDNENEQAPDIKGLREAAKRSDTYKSEAEAAKRELAFVKAGIDPDDPKAGYFVRGYQGDVEPSAIKAAAIEAGFLQAQVDAGQQQAQAGQSAVNAIQGGGTNQRGTQQDSFQELIQAAEHGTAGLAAVAAKYGIQTINP